MPKVKVSFHGIIREIVIVERKLRMIQRLVSPATKKKIDPQLDKLEEAKKDVISVCKGKKNGTIVSIHGRSYHIPPQKKKK
jgi:hypothetical protein